jgi:hypothetical protein
MLPIMSGISGLRKGVQDFFASMEKNVIIPSVVLKDRYSKNIGLTAHCHP